MNSLGHHYFTKRHKSFGKIIKDIKNEKWHYTDLAELHTGDTCIVVEVGKLGDRDSEVLYAFFTLDKQFAGLRDESYFSRIKNRKVLKSLKLLYL